MRWAVAASMLLTGWAVLYCAADTFYVNPDVGDNAWNGRCDEWDGSYCGPKRTIQAAVDSAVSGDRVVLAPGTYSGPGNRDVYFEGKAIRIESVDPLVGAIVATTIIDCLDGQNRHRAFCFVDGEGPDSVVAGLTIVGGLAPLELYPPLGVYLPGGGAIFCDQSYPTIERCRFIENTANLGGAILTWEFGTGQPPGGGGGPDFELTGRIVDCVFEQNETQMYSVQSQQFYGSGGAIDINGHGVLGHRWVIENCRFVENTCADGLSTMIGGGAVQVQEGAIVEIRGCRFESNLCLSGQEGGNGGALLVRSNADVVVRECEFSNNYAELNGAAIYAEDTALAVVSCRFNGNWARLDDVTHGGAIGVGDSAVVTVVNCELAGNVAQRGGAIGLAGSDSELLVSNCTLVGNRALEAEAIWWSLGTLEVNNSVIWNGPDWFSETDLEVNYCVVDGGWLWGAGNTGEPPMFRQPGYWDLNGTPGNMLDDIWVHGDHRVQRGSSCVDAGSNELVVRDTYDLDGDGNLAEPLSMDLGLLPRMRDDLETPDTGVGGPPVVDIGAWEFHPTVVRGDTNCDREVSFADINPFILRLSNLGAYQVAYPGCPDAHSDVNLDGSVDFGDINPFIAILSAPDP